MRVFDTILYNGEWELLDLRLNVLNDFVDFFIISECERTFSQLIKPLFFKEQVDKFKKFWKKIIYNKIEPLPWIENGFNNEWYQRNVIWLVLDYIASPNDAIMHSGVDEILDTKKLKQYLDQDSVMFEMRPCYYYINCVDTEMENWPGTFLLKKKTLDEYYVKDGRYIIDKNCEQTQGGKPFEGKYWAEQNFGLERARYEKRSFSIQVKNGGWHYCWYGDTSRMATKVLSDPTDAHKRGISNQAQLQNQLEKLEGVDPHHRKILTRVELDENIAPQYVLDHPDQFRILK